MPLKNLKRITKEFFLSKKIIIFQFVFLITQLIKLSLPLIMIYIVNNTLLKNNYLYIKEAIILSIILLIVYSLLSFFSNFFFIDYLNDKSENLKKELFMRCLSSDSEFYEKHNSGDMAYRITNDVNVLISGWTFIFGSTIAHLISIIVFLFLIKFHIILLLFIIINIGKFYISILL